MGQIRNSYTFEENFDRTDADILCTAPINVHWQWSPSYDSDGRAITERIANKKDWSGGSVKNCALCAEVIGDNDFYYASKTLHTAQNANRDNYCKTCMGCHKCQAPLKRTAYPKELGIQCLDCDKMVKLKNSGTNKVLPSVDACQSCFTANKCRFCGTNEFYDRNYKMAA
jgi:hypothetical protein